MTRTTRYTTIRDLARDIAETDGLNIDLVHEAISRHRHLFSRYDTVTPEELAALHQAVWFDLTGTEYDPL